MDPRRRATILISLAATTIFSSTVLPMAVPPFGAYPASQVLEVLLWQGIATIGWPFAIFGALLSIPSGAASSFGPFLPTLLYPALFAFGARVLISKSSRTWELVLLHLLIVASFVAIWYPVRNGYDFMAG
jgi:hypothetical protein